MKSIINYIGKLFAKENKYKHRSAANKFIKISIEGQSGVGDSRLSNRIYNKHNLWVAFNRYNDVVQPDKTPGEYSFKNHNRDIGIPSAQ